jgi:serine protease Do
MAQAMGLDSMKGALVSDVVKDGPAGDSGLESGDVIVSLDGQDIDNTAHLRNAIAALPPGTKVELEVVRDGKKKDIEVKLGELDSEEMVAATGNRIESLFGCQVATLTGDLAQKYAVRGTRAGVVVTAVSPDGAVARAGMREGDVIVAVNRRKVESVNKLEELTSDLKKGDNVLMQVVRGNRSFFIAIRV